MRDISREIIDSSEEEVAAIETKMFRGEVSNIASEIELANFITANIGVFKSSYHRLYSYVKAWMYGSEGLFSENGIYEGAYIDDIAQQQKWSASLRRAISEILNNKWPPTRMKIISLGIHMNMDRSQIDDMLRCAHMQELYAKNILEALIIYILENAVLDGIYDVDSDDYETYGLLNYTYDVLEQFRDYPEIDAFRGEIAKVESDV